MIHSYYSVRDTKADLYYPPFCAANQVFAKRAVSVAAQQPDSNLNRFPSDFELRFVAYFNDHTGEWTPVKPEFVCTILSLLPREGSTSLTAERLKEEANSVDAKEKLQVLSKEGVN